LACRYEEGTSLVHKTGSAAAFIKTDSPVEFLGSYNSITFEGPAGQRLLALKETDAEVRALCEDLKVLGKREFKHLLKWRIAVRQQEKAEQEPEEEEEAAGGEAAAEEGGSEREEETMLDEMAELRAAMEAKKKAARKAAAKKKEKAKARTSTGMAVDATGEEEGVYGDEELFSLRSIKSGKGLAKVVPDDEEEEGGEEDEEMEGGGEETGAGEEQDGEEEDDLDSDVDEKR
jgi:AdoMet-dependent rRNA methyltransferase SPB1